MLAQTAIAFPEVRAVLDRAEQTLAKDLEKPLGRFVYPPSAFTPDQEAANRKDLQRTEVAQPALGATSLGMFKLLSALGVEADFFAGHSYGEYAALAATGALGEADLFRLSYQRGKVIRDAAASAAGGMIAVDATPQALEPLLKGVEGVWVANHNSPSQTVLAGTEDGLKAAATKLQAASVRNQRIPVACGFHSPLIAGAKAPLAAALSQAKFATPRKPVYSNTTGKPHGTDIAAQLAEHLVSPVKFADEVVAMHAAGARVFVEVGPQAVLTGLTAQTLAGKPHVALASDVKSRPGLVQLAHLLGQLFVAGVPVKLDRLFQGRTVQAFDLAKLGPDTGKPKIPATAWVVNGVRSRPINGPEPRLLGQNHSGVPTTAPASITVKPAAAAKVSTNGDHAPAPKPAAVTAPAPVAAPKPIPAVAAQVTVAARPAPTHTLSVVPGITPAMNTTEPARVAASNNGHAHQTPDGAAAVMMRFQEVMAKFLDTQKSVMLGYLGAGGTAPAANGHAAQPLNGNGYANGHSNGNGYANGHSNGHAAVPAPAPAPAVTNRIATVEPVARPAAPVAVPATNGHVTHAAPETNGKHAPEPVKPAAVVAPAAPAAALDRDSLLVRLLDLVSERTGYPKEALSIDLDLEADLGVDSIKRVEILGTLAESIGTGADGKQPNLEMEKLSTIKTLRGIADYVSEALAGGSDAPAPAAVTAIEPSANGTHAKAAPAAERNGDLHPGARQGEVQRLVVRLIDAPLPARPKFAPPTGTILLTDDGRGTARELADRLAELDVKTALIRMADGKAEGFAADLTDPSAVADLLARVREACGPVSGLIHLLPLAEPAETETPEQRMRREVKSLYLLSRGLETDIRAAGKAGSGVLLAVTAMGGRMGFGGDLPADFFAGHGGVAGFTKCLGYEWPEVTVRVVDVDGETPATHLAEDLLAELGDADGPFEVGVAGETRKTWQVEPGPLAKDEAAIDLDANSTVLITGGARGITARVALELATRYKSKLVLVGSSPLPAAEAADTAGLAAQAEIKAALLKRQPDAKPALIEAAYRRLLKDREILGNLDAIRKAGSAVEYRSVDVRDAKAFGALLDELNATAGGITGVIHGAGVIEDKLLRDKTPESFDRVFGTKVDSAMTLVRHLDPAKVKFLSVFASITSRYGNRGQSDYAAANEVLSKLACDLDRRWPGRVVSVAWGPWAEVGMVADLEKHLVARGLKLIEPAVGGGFAVDEVVFGTKGEPEVLIAGGTEHARPKAAAAPELATAGAQ
jgi:acyl transferase domain-containing protein